MAPYRLEIALLPGGARPNGSSTMRQQHITRGHRLARRSRFVDEPRRILRRGDAAVLHEVEQRLENLDGRLDVQARPRHLDSRSAEDEGHACALLQGAQHTIRGTREPRSVDALGQVDSQRSGIHETSHHLSQR